MDYEHLSRLVAVLRIDTTRWLACAADIEPVRLRDVDVLVGVFGHSWTNGGEVLLCFRTRRTGIDEGIEARL